LNRRCDGCLFWSRGRYGVPAEAARSHDGAAALVVPFYGECRVQAPRLSKFDRWPLTNADEWCGKFQPLPVVQVPAQEVRT